MWLQFAFALVGGAALVGFLVIKALTRPATEAPNPQSVAK